jgi:hypothetical protein
MENNDEVTGVEPMRSAFSRRTALKGAGVGVAVWAAPTVLSMGSAAHAASNAPPLACNGCDPNGDPCGNQTPCGDPSEGCSCKTVAAGGSCLCTANGYCEDFQECPLPEPVPAELRRWCGHQAPQGLQQVRRWSTDQPPVSSSTDSPERAGDPIGSPALSACEETRSHLAAIAHAAVLRPPHGLA